VSDTAIGGLWIFAVYDHPSDYSEEYVCRAHLVTPGQVTPHSELFYRDRSLSNVELHLQHCGLVPIPNLGEPDRTIVSVWA